MMSPLYFTRSNTFEKRDGLVTHLTTGSVALVKFKYIIHSWFLHLTYELEVEEFFLGSLSSGARLGALSASKELHHTIKHR